MLRRADCLPHLAQALFEVKQQSLLLEETNVTRRKVNLVLPLLYTLRPAHVGGQTCVRSTRTRFG